MIELKNVTYTYPHSDRPALSNLSFMVRPGEAILVTGVSGCGKSTLIRLINGLCPHYYGGNVEGTICIDGKDNMKEKLCDISHRVGTLFQNPESQFFALGVEEEISFISECKGVHPKEIQTKLSQTAERFNLKPFLKSIIHELSQGQKQKVGLASLMMEPLKALILDEPTGNLDPEATLELAEEIKKLKAQGVAILIVDHRLYWLKDVVDKVIVLEKGKVVREGIFPDLDSEFREKYGLRKLEVTDKRLLLPVKTSSGKPIMKISKLSFSYPRQPEIITDASLEFQQGICGIFGDNSAGKTTLARLITGLNKAKSGTFQVKGKTIRQKDCLKHVAVVLQNSDHQLYMRTVFEELRASLEAAGCKGGNDAAEELLGIFDLQELRDRHPHSLSGGQKQRLVIACAFAKKPDVIILDEPTSGLDGANLKRIAGTLKKLSSEGKAVLVITHDLELVDLICDTALHLPLPVQTANQPFIN